MRVVENVVPFKAEFEFNPLGDRRCLGEGHIPIPETRTMPVVAGVIRYSANQRSVWSILRVCGTGKGARVWHEHVTQPHARLPAPGRWVCKRIANLFAPSSDTGSLRIYGA